MCTCFCAVGHFTLFVRGSHACQNHTSMRQGLQMVRHDIFAFQNIKMFTSRTWDIYRETKSFQIQFDPMMSSRGRSVSFLRSMFGNEYEDTMPFSHYTKNLESLFYFFMESMQQQSKYWHVFQWFFSNPMTGLQLIVVQFFGKGLDC